MRRGVAVLVALLVGTCAAVNAGAGVRVAGHDNLEGQFAFGVSGGLVEPAGQIGNEPDWSVPSRANGLDLRYGWNGSVFADFYVTSFLSAGLWCGRSELGMRDQTLSTASGTETFHSLLRGTTSFVGARVKGFLPTERAWTPYAFVGVVHAFRRAEFSNGMLQVAPGTDVLTVTDDNAGFEGGLGMEQPLNRWLGVTASATYFYSGALKHELEWRGRTVPVNNWEYWSVEVGFTCHAGPHPGPSAR